MYRSNYLVLWNCCRDFYVSVKTIVFWWVDFSQFLFDTTYKICNVVLYDNPLEGTIKICKNQKKILLSWSDVIVIE